MITGLIQMHIINMLLPNDPDASGVSNMQAKQWHNTNEY
jgi:hypothetical protein